MNKMTGGQLTQIYNIATTQGCGQDEIQYLIQSGYMSDFFAGKWHEVNRTDFRELGHLETKRFSARRNFKTVLKLNLGTVLKTTDDFRKALKTADCTVSDSGNKILNKIVIKSAKHETEVEMVVVSNLELGLKNGATATETYTRAKKFDLKLCPNEVGPQLCLQYNGRLKGLESGKILVAMEPITDSQGNHIFCVDWNYAGHATLTGEGGPSDHRFYHHVRWVFLRYNSL